MELSARTTVAALLDAHPFLLDYLASLSPKFAKLKNPLLRATMAKIAPLSQVASMGGLDLDDLLLGLATEIYRRTDESVTLVNPGGRAASPAGTAPAGRAERIKILKDIVLRLHRGETVDSVRSEFHSLLRDVSPAEIGAMEQDLVRDGIPEAEIKRLCQLHVELFTAGQEVPELPDLPAGHPLHTLRAENREAEARAARLQEAADRARDPLSLAAARAGLAQGLQDLSRIIRHYERKENQLFPLMERHGLTAPPQVMWEIHDDIRRQFKQAQALLEAGDPDAARVVGELCVAVRDMVFKEERVLLPMVWEAFDEAEWAEVRRGEEEIGFAWVAPGADWRPSPAASPRAPSPAPGLLDLDTGRLAPATLNAILKALPVDLSFVGADNRVAYYSDTPDRIFPRSAGVIGREVTRCHPPKSVHLVEEILRAFSAGERDAAEFWIELSGRFLHIRYFAVRDPAGAYLGCLEVSQDVTAIRALEGQKRLLDWK